MLHPELLNPFPESFVELPLFVFFHLCVLLNGSQCCQPYLCTAHMPSTGTKTKLKQSILNVYGLFSAHAEKWIIISYLKNSLNPIPSLPFSILDVSAKYSTNILKSSLPSSIPRDISGAST